MKAAFRRIGRFCLILGLLVLPALPVWAGEAIVNSEVAVDVTGKDAADARTEAMAKGQSDALLELLGKLVPSNQAQAIVDSLDSKKIGAMVRGTEVLDEKITDNRYRGHLRISFDGDEISKLIGKATSGEPGADVTATVGSFLIIPSYEENGIQMLWEDSNPWRNAWKAVGLEVISGDVVVPYGDATDSAVVDLKTLSSANYASLVAMMIRYGVSDVVIVQAKYTQEPDLMLTVTKRRINRTLNEVSVLSYRADPQETRDLLLTRAARDIAENLQHKKTEELETSKVVHGGERNKIMVLANISTLASWTELRTKLSTLPMIDRIELLAMGASQVDMVLYYRGSAESLARAIVGSQIRLVQNKDYWVISRD